MNSILVTGGAGYIGSHTCKALAQAGYQPVTLDNLSRGHRWAVKWGPLEVGDIADDARVIQVVEQYAPQAVIHFAGYGYVGESMLEPELYYSNNVTGSHCLLKALVKTGLKKLIFSSSCATYGIVPDRPVTEDVPQQPISTYGLSKLIVERMLADYQRAYGFRSISLRYFNAAGADPDGEIGEEHDPEPHIIPSILKAAAGETDGITINGEDYPTPDGSCVRDFIHVSDLADAHVRALKLLLSGGEHRAAYNLGNGRGYSLKTIARVAREVTGREFPVRIGPRRAGDPPFAVGDATLAGGELGWRPRFGDIAAIVRSAWDWMIRDRYATTKAV